MVLISYSEPHRTAAGRTILVSRRIITTTSIGIRVTGNIQMTGSSKPFEWGERGEVYKRYKMAKVIKAWIDLPVVPSDFMEKSLTCLLKVKICPFCMFLCLLSPSPRGKFNSFFASYSSSCLVY